MAKKSEEPRVNKAKAIREYKDGNRSQGPSDIATALNAREGWNISPAYVSNILMHAKKKKRKKGKVGRPAKNAAAAVESSGGVNEQALMQAKKLAAQVGVNEAKAAIDLLAKLMS